MKPAPAYAKRAAQAALEDRVLLDCYLVIDDTDEFITEIRTIIRKRSADGEFA